jgi:hypothetical protein
MVHAGGYGGDLTTAPESHPRQRDIEVMYESLQELQCVVQPLHGRRAISGQPEGAWPLHIGILAAGRSLPFASACSFETDTAYCPVIWGLEPQCPHSL